jgi:hypothetical protein
VFSQQTPLCLFLDFGAIGALAENFPGAKRNNLIAQPIKLKAANASVSASFPDSLAW